MATWDDPLDIDERPVLPAARPDEPSETLASVGPSILSVASNEKTGQSPNAGDDFRQMTFHLLTGG
jgi:hypothetical protein